MRFFSSAVLAVSALSSLVLAAPQATGTVSAPAPTSPPSGTNPNPISLPTAGTKCQAGVPCSIEWDATTDGTITLKLRMGASDNLDTVETIAADIPNTGKFTWTPEKTLEGDDTYAIEIVSADGVSNYSPQFAIDSDGKGKPSTTTTAESTTTTEASSTSTTESTTSATTTETATSTTTDEATTTTHKPTKTTTSTKPTATDDGEDTAPNPNGTGAANGLISAQSPLALILCVGAALAYLS